MPASRRRFLSNLAAVTAALRSVSANPLAKPIGLQLYTLSADLQQDFNGTLAKVAHIGIKEVEIASTYNKSAAQWKTALTANGLHCRSVHVYDASQTPDQVMAFASELGARYVVTSLNPPPEILAKATSTDWTPLVKAVETMTLDDWKKSVDIANHLGDQAAKHGLVYCYHNHNLEFKKFGSTTPFELLMTKTNPATVKFEMDCGWVSAAGHNPSTILEKHADRIRLLHIKAFQPAPPNTNLVGPLAPKATELGRGAPNYQPIFTAAAKAQVEQYYIEQEPPFTKLTALQAVQVDYDYLHTLAT